MKRKTIQSELVYETVNRLCSHATADEVYDEIRKEHPSISRATVYRNLNQLSQSGRVQRVTVPNGADRFDHNCQKHYHVICEKCGKAFDLDMDIINNLTEKVRNADGFTFTGYEILFSGICPSCGRQEKDT